MAISAIVHNELPRLFLLVFVVYIVHSVCSSYECEEIIEGGALSALPVETGHSVCCCSKKVARGSS